MRLSLLPVVIALAAPAGADAFPARDAVALKCPKTFNVKVGDDGSRLFFSKEKLTIGKGACVRWSWTGVLQHQVVTPDGLRSERRTAPYTYRRSFIRPRVKPYRIFCAVHPQQMDMTVRVKPARAGSAKRL